MVKIIKTTLTLLIFLTVFSLNTSAQYVSSIGLLGYTGGGIAFNPDGTTLASSGGKTIKLWNVKTGDLLNTLEGHSGFLVFSPDGTTLASSTDKTIRLWELSDTRVSITALPVDALAIGDQLTFNINITEGENVTGYEAVVHFDETALRYVEGVNGDYLPDDSFFVPPVVEGDSVNLGATSLAESSSGDGTLAILTFEFIAVKESTVTLSKTRLVNSAGEPLSHLNNRLAYHTYEKMSILMVLLTF